MKEKDTVKSKKDDEIGNTVKDQSFIVSLSLTLLVIIISIYMSNKYDWIKRKDIRHTIIIYVVMLFMIAMSYLFTTIGQPEFNQKITFPVYKNKKWNNFINKIRGKNYCLQEGVKSSDPGLITSWHIYHFWMYFMLGLLAPNLTVVALIVGIGWEIFEYTFDDFADLTDIFWNMFGFFSGKFVNKIFNNNKNNNNT